MPQREATSPEIEAQVQEVRRKDEHMDGAAGT
jgi:hypothetical protein